MEKQPRQPVDPSGTLPSGQVFNGPGELKAILKAEQTAPQPTRNSPPAREVVSHLLRTRRKTDLIELSLRMGL